MAIKVISLNLWWGGNLFDEIVDFLKEQNADIVLLQEAYNAQSTELPPKFQSIKRLKQALDYEHVEFAQAYLERNEYGLVPHGNAILSKFPIESSSLKFMVGPSNVDHEYQDILEHWPIMPAPLQHAEITTPAGMVNIYNVHGVWDLDGDSYSERRQQMTKAILSETKDKPNAILAGDTNAKATNQAMRDLEPQLKSVFGPDIKTTFNMRRKDNPGYATAAVDLMFVSPSIKVLSRAVPDVDISDHLPLVVTLEIT